jgi:ATP-dependent Clp protease ATP-binding subunit ClpB
MTLTIPLDAYARDARALISSAQALADERKHAEVEPIHLLYRMTERDATLQAAFERAGVDPGDVLVEAEAQLRRLPRIPDAVAYLSPRLLDLLGRAEGEAARAGGQPVGVQHLVVAAAQESSGPVAAVLRAVGLSAPVLRATMAGALVADDAARAKFGLGPAPRPEGAGAAPAAARPVSDPIARFTRDLTSLAAQGRFDPTIGRDEELRRMLQVLARRRDNNPLLVGEPGIGKTAIVHALAARMAVGDVPRMLEGKRLVQLDTGALVAGAKLRGELEERMRQLLDALRDAGGAVVLFLPDLGALTAERTAGDLLAAALARGEVRAVAVATNEAVKKATEEGTLVRRFVPIPVAAPTVDETVAVLRGIVSRFEIAHGVRISDPALVAAARFARRYVPGVALPRSAVDLVDEAAARVRVENDSVPAELDRLERRMDTLRVQLASLEDDDDDESKATRAALAAELRDLEPRAKAMRARWQEELDRLAEIRRLKEEIAAARRDEEAARAAGDTVRADGYLFGAIPLLEKQLREAEAKLGRADGAVSGAGAVGAAPDGSAPPVGALVRDVVGAEDVAAVVSSWTGVPVAKMLEGEAEKLLCMEQRLGQRVVGQDAAVRAVARAVRRGRVGLRDPKKPIGSFLFLGPSGVGKTELAKALAEFLFDDELAMTRLDMSEFMEKHTVARLIGSPPGYVDSDEGGFLTEAVRRRPYSVVLFDELEKAHPDVFNILLQVLDDGRLTDSRGNLAYFSDTVIIMTSNIGGHVILEHVGDDASLREKVNAELRKAFRPEFINRIDEIVVFDRLSMGDLRGITDIQLRGLGRLLAERRIALEVSDRARDKLTELGYEPAFGARPLKRVILRHLQDPLAEEILRGGWGPGDTVVVDLDDAGDFRFLRR